MYQDVLCPISPAPLADVRSGLTIAALVRQFLQDKQARHEARELGTNNLRRHRAAGRLLIQHFGGARRIAELTAAEFEALGQVLADRWSAISGDRLRIGLRGIFRFAREAASPPAGVGPGLVEKLGRPRPRVRIDATARQQAVDAQLAQELAGVDPALPCRWLPGSAEKVWILEQRASAGLPLFVAGDAKLNDRAGYLPFHGHNGAMEASTGAAAIVEELPGGMALRFVGRKAMKFDPSADRSIAA